EMMKALRAEAKIFCYVEFSDEAPMQVHLRSVAFAGEKSAWQASFGEGSPLRFTDFYGFFSDDGIQKVIHNAKNLQLALLKEGQIFRGLEWDTMLLSYLTQPNRSNHQFEEIAFAHLQKNPAKLAADRTTATRELFHLLHPKILEEGLEQVYQEIEKPLSEVLAAMEFTGIRIDFRSLEELSIECEKKLDTLSLKIFELAGTDFNISSPKQLGEILFDKLNLPAPKKLKK